MGFDPSGILGECFVHICVDASLSELSIDLFGWREFKNRIYLEQALLNFDFGAGLPRCLTQL